MRAIEPDEVFVKASGHEFNQVPDGYVVYHSGRDRVHFLNPTAVVVYELCDGQHTVEQIGRFIQDSWSLSEPPTVDVRTCLSNFLEEGIVEKSPQAPANPATI
jgi:hypothetical protein